MTQNKKFFSILSLIMCINNGALYCEQVENQELSQEKKSTLVNFKNLFTKQIEQKRHNLFTDATEELRESVHENLVTFASNVVNDTIDSMIPDDSILERFIIENQEKISADWERITNNYADSLLQSVQQSIATGIVNYLIFNNEIAQHKNVVAVFGSQQFPPCALMDPIIDKLSAEYNDTISFIVIDSTQFNVPGIEIKNVPTLIFYKDGQAVDMQVGLGIDQETVQELIDELEEEHDELTPEKLNELLMPKICELVEQELRKNIVETFELD